MKCGCSIYFSQFCKSYMSRCGYVISESPLDFEITRVDCTCNRYILPLRKANQYIFKESTRQNVFFFVLFVVKKGLSLKELICSIPPPPPHHPRNVFFWNCYVSKHKNEWYQQFLYTYRLKAIVKCNDS